MSLSNTNILNLKNQKNHVSFQQNGNNQNGIFFKYLAGDNYVLKNLTLEDSINQSYAQLTNSGNNLNVNGVSGIFINGNLVSSGSVSLSELSIPGNSTFYGNVNVLGTLQFTGAIASDDLKINGDGTFTNNLAAKNVSISQHIDISGNLIVKNKLLYVDSTSNKIGINTTNPIYYLHIENTIGSDGLFISGFNSQVNIQNSVTQANLQLYNGPSDYGFYSYLPSATSVYKNLVFNNNGHGGVTSVDLVINTDSNIGMNTTGIDTNSKLTIANGNTSNTSTKNQIAFNYNNTDRYAHSIKTRHNSGGTGGNAIDFYTWDHSIDTSSTIGTKHGLTIEYGNIGIGKTNPTSNLDIDGTVFIEGYATFNNKVFISGLHVSSNVTISGSLNVNESSIFNNQISSNTLNITNSATFNSNVRIQNLNVVNNVSVSGNLNILEPQYVPKINKYPLNNDSHLITVTNGRNTYLINDAYATRSYLAVGSGLGGINSIFPVANIMVVSNGKLYIGGDFTTIDGIIANRIAVLDIATNTWSSLGTGGNNGLDGVVYSIAVSGDNIYVGGDFSNAGTTSASRIAVYNIISDTWSSLDSGTNDRVSALAISGNILYVGGSFTTVNGTTARGIAYRNILTNTWGYFGSNGLNLAGKVYKIKISGDSVYIGGQFSSVDSVSANNIATYSISGTTWTALGTGTDSLVNALEISGSNLYVGGVFTTAGGISTGILAKWNGSTWSSLSFPTVNIFSRINDLNIFDNKLYIIGDYEGPLSTLTYISYLDLSLNTYTNIGANNFGYSIANDGINNVYFSGYYTIFAGISANYISKLLVNYSNSVNLTFGTPIKYIQYDTIVTTENLLFDTVGQFATIHFDSNSGFGYLLNDNVGYNLNSNFDHLNITNNATFGNNLSIANDLSIGNNVSIGGNIIITGSLIVPGDVTFGNNLSTNSLKVTNNANIGNSLIVTGGISGDYLIIGGNVTFGNNLSTNTLKVTNNVDIGNSLIVTGGISGDYLLITGNVTFGNLLTVSGLNVKNNVNITGALKVQGNEVIDTSTIGNYLQAFVNYTSDNSTTNITTTNGIYTYYIDSPTTLYYNNISNGTDGTIYSIAVSGDKKFIAGNFTLAGNVASANLALYNTSTDTWTDLGIDCDSAVYTIVSDGTNLYVGGNFTQIGGIAANYIAKYDFTTDTWSTLGTGVDSAVYTIAISGTDIYVGGFFINAGGSGANRIAKWDGTNWSALGTGLNNGVYTLTIDGTDVYVGGVFTTAGGSTSNRVAKWDTVTTTWSSLGSGGENGVDDRVNSIVVSGTDIYIGGHFLNAGTTSARKIAKWDGSNWTALGTGLNDNVNTMVLTGTKLYIGGNFTKANNSTAVKLAIYDTSSTTWSAGGNNINNIVRSLLLDGTNLYVGGDFTKVNNYDFNYCFMIDTTASLTQYKKLTFDIPLIYNDTIVKNVTSLNLYSYGQFVTIKFNGTYGIILNKSFGVTL